MNRGTILLVDDDPGLLQLLRMRLQAFGFTPRSADSGESALASMEAQRPDAVITDLRMDGMDGLALFERIRARWPGLPVIVLTAHGSIREAVLATQQGVFSFLTKPVDKDELLTTLNRALQLSPEHGSGPGRTAAGDEGWADAIHTRSPKMYRLLDQARLLAHSDVNVLIAGESGTGKELLAHAIHNASARAGRAFVAINCSAIPADLLESELFGHVRGAFSGATRDHDGLFVAASGGTLLLDEIGDMPLPLQIKLLRVLQERAVRPVGGLEDRPVDVRVLSATHCDLQQAIADKQFREDLYYRLNVVTLTLPGLRERREDIALLADHFLDEIAARSQQPARRLNPAALAALAAYDWPGNVRQLQNVIEQVVALSPGPVIAEALIRDALPPNGAEPLESLSEAKRRFERDYVQRLLAASRGNIAEAARLAGRNRSDFYKVLKRHGIDPAEQR